MDAPRLLFVNRFYWPDEAATALMLTDLARHLAGQGYRVEIYTSRLLYTDARRRLPPTETNQGVRIHRVWSTRFGRHNLLGRFFDYLTFYTAVFLTLLRRAGPDTILVVKTDPPLLSILAALVRMLTGTRAISWCQDVFPEIVWARKPRAAWPLPAHLLRQLRNWSLRQMDASVVLGEDMAAYLRAELGPRARLATIGNWADGTAIRPLAATPALRQEWGLADVFVVGYSGNLGRVHDYETLLQAAQLLRDEPDIHFLFVGSGALRNRLESELPEDLRGRFHFQPYQPRERLGESLAVPDVHWLSLQPSCTAYVFPSKFYGIAAAGKPTVFVGSAEAEIARLLHTQDFGAAIPAGDAPALAAALRALKHDPARRQRQGQAARAWFDRAAAAHIPFGQWEDLIDSLDGGLALDPVALPASLTRAPTA